MEPLAVKPNVAFTAVGVGNTKGWELIAKGDLETYNVGRARLVTTDSIKRFVERRLAEAKAA